jgi:hypothetical protein
MTYLYYIKQVEGRINVSEGYVLATPRIATSRFRNALAILAILGIVLSALGLVAGIIVPKAWAAGVFVIGAAAFCIAGYFARHNRNIRRRSVAAWQPIT